MQGCRGGDDGRRNHECRSRGETLNASQETEEKECRRSREGEHEGCVEEEVHPRGGHDAGRGEAQDGVDE